MEDITKIAIVLEISFTFVHRSFNEEADVVSKSAFNVVTKTGLMQ